MTGARSPIVGLVPHRDRPVAHELAPARRIGSRHGLEVRILERRRRGAGSRRARRLGATSLRGLDLAISLGGDGTMLRTVDLVYEAGAAVLGVNVGQMGYLTEVEPADLDSALERVVEGDFEIDERMVLDVSVASKGEAAAGGGGR